MIYYKIDQFPSKREIPSCIKGPLSDSKKIPSETNNSSSKLKLSMKSLPFFKLSLRSPLEAGNGSFGTRSSKRSFL